MLAHYQTAGARGQVTNPQPPHTPSSPLPAHPPIPAPLSPLTFIALTTPAPFPSSYIYYDVSLFSIVYLFSFFI